MDKITFCIPSKSNLRYLKTCIPSIRKNAFRNDHDITVFVDQDEDGTLKWLGKVSKEYNVKILVNPNLGESLYGIGKAYDKCIQDATTDVVMVFHADMMLGKHADKKAYDLLKAKTAVCSTRVEPPLHPNNGEKIIRDFGMWPEEFQSDAFDQFVETQLDETKITEGIFAPWMVYREEFLAIGGHDPILKSCREDSDVFNRMMLAGFIFKQPWNSLVYHLTGRGAGSFSGDKERHHAWQKEMNNSTREYIRKWGCGVLHNNFMKPIIPPKYNIGLVLYSTTPEALHHLEPWFDKVWIDSPFLLGYVQNEQKNTAFNLAERVFAERDNYDTNIVVHLDAKNFNNEQYNYIQQLSQILAQHNQTGTFELGQMRIEVNSLEQYQDSLIFI